MRGGVGCAVACVPARPLVLSARKHWRGAQDGAGVQGSGLPHHPGACPVLVTMLHWHWGWL